MCCGCLRLLGKDGKTIGEPFKGGGAVNLSELAARFSGLREAARDFSTKEECDHAALAAGWTVKDPDGIPNHRCPGCKLIPPDTYRSGAYIDWDAT